MDIILSTLQQPLYFTIYAMVIGLCVGSFLNVVIHRLPLMMKIEWRQECLECLEMPAEEVTEKLSLSKPRSRCPGCKSPIKIWQNIPVISYLLLRGKCAACSAPISIRYPLVELGTGLLTGFIAWHFGFGLQAAAAIILCWGLIAIAFIDFDNQFIPDTITLPLLWLGLFLNLEGLFTPLSNAVLGAIIGYCSLWLFTKAFYLVTGKIGMGHGDFKLFAMFGAWLGWQNLPFILIAASIVGAIIGIFMIVFRNNGKDTQFPFGHYLVIAGVIALLWGDTIIHWYLNLFVI